MNYDHAIIMCGGSGTRLRPLTDCINKHFLPVYDKPMFYYAFANLLHLGIRNFTIVGRSSDLPLYKRILEKFELLGTQFTFLVQDKAAGIADGLILFEKHFGRKDTILALGDNLFFGNSIKDDLSNVLTSTKSGVVLQHVANPNEYGVAKFNADSSELHKIIEKPKKFEGNCAVTGLYFYRKEAFSYLDQLTPSGRGELEITDLNNLLIENGKLTFSQLGRAVSWFDAGDTASMLDASALVRSIQERTGLLVGSPEEILFQECAEQLKLDFLQRQPTPKSKYELSLKKLMEF